MNFKKWFENSFNMPNSYLSPDYHLSHGDQNIVDQHITFVYTSDGVIHYSKGTHTNVVYDNPSLITRYQKSRMPDGMYDRQNLVNDDLFGRLGPLENNPQVKLVSFWGENAELFNQHLKNCLAQLQKDGHIQMEKDAISTPHHQTVLIKNLFPATTLTPAAKNQHQNQLAMHLMPGNMKKQALQQVGYSGSTPHPMQASMNQLGMNRGQKWWTTSESSNE